jgi:hypothetical protein
VILRAAAALALAALAGPVRGDEPVVAYADGALSVRCADAPLATLLERIQAATGVVLIVEGNDDATRLTADLPPLPVARAIPRLLEGTGIGYLLVADPGDASRVATVYVSVGKAAPTPGGSLPPAAPLPAARLAARTPEAMPQELVEAIAEAQAEAEADEDEEISTDPPAPPPEAPPPAAGFHPVLDPFGRPIPTDDRAGRRRARKGVGSTER